MKDIQILRDREHYETTKTFFINYVNKLLNKRHIERKKPLREIKHNLMTKGYIQLKYHYNLLLSYLNHDSNLKDININDYLYSLESYQKQEQTTSQPTLEEFFK